MKQNKSVIGISKKNNFGSTMIIVGYNNFHDIQIYFPEYKWTMLHGDYKSFENGNMKCPFERRTYEIGYLGDGPYTTYDIKNKKSNNCYNTWCNMLKRCYSGNQRYKTYDNCIVCDEWHNYQNFAKWYYDNFYNCNNELMDLDKDIIKKHNNIYSPDTCVFVPHRINVLFIKNNKKRGNLPIGVSKQSGGDKYRVRCNIDGYEKQLGVRDTVEEAFNLYKQYKENLIKSIAEEYKQYIPEKLYKAMCEYKVDIQD